jgi:hypothetical protein
MRKVQTISPSTIQNDVTMLLLVAAVLQMAADLLQALVAFRDSAVHSTPAIRAPIEAAIRKGAGDYVEEASFYRVCTRQDVVFNTSPGQPGFVSCCSSLEAARTLLKVHPPNPLANTIVELTATGKIIHMYYTDGQAGARKAWGNEVIVPLAAVTRVRIV